MTAPADITTAWQATVAAVIAIAAAVPLGIASAGGFGSPGRSTWRPNLPPRLRQ
jgi:hypothetical protein